MGRERTLLDGGIPVWSPVRNLVDSYYDLQRLRIAVGRRMKCSSFYVFSLCVRERAMSVSQSVLATRLRLNPPHVRRRNSQAWMSGIVYAAASPRYGQS